MVFMERINFNLDWTCSGNDGVKKPVTLPHDAMIHEKRDKNSPSKNSGAYFHGGVYEYEKSFSVPGEWTDKCVAFLFEGVYKNSTVYINGKEAGGCAYGYSQFYVTATGHLLFGQENVIKVVARNDDQPNSRWYTGAGIYRPVWLLLAGKKHIDFDGVKVTTLLYNPAKIRVDTAHTGGSAIRVEILDGNQVVANSSGKMTEISIPNAKLWSDTEPNLYECRVSLLENGALIDTVTVSFGIRVIEWSAKGLFINGKETLLRGGCVHHTNGIVGACAFAKSEERRVRIMKEFGYNAIRSAHNPASTAMLAACDRLGMYVMDETWDMWYNRKSKYDYAGDFPSNYEYDVRTLVARDYNHPSVIMYSIGNEVSEPASLKGIQMTKDLVALFHKLDATRPVTAGFNLMIISRSAKGKGMYKDDGGLTLNEDVSNMNNMSSTMFNLITSFVGPYMNNMANSKKTDAITSPCLDALDIAGYNYASGRYPLEAKAHPSRVIVGSETFMQDIVKNWEMVKKYPYLVGDFMWTAWDYLGEVGLGAWGYTADAKGFTKPYPWLLADSGAIDILGNSCGEVYLAQAVWDLLEKPMITVQPVNHPETKPSKSMWRGTNGIPSWSWKKFDSNSAVVEVYTRAAFVELLLNSKRLGKKRVKKYAAKFNVKYVAGTLTAVAYDSAGREIGRNTLQSSFGKLQVRLTPEESSVEVGDIVYVNVDIVGNNGVVESNADTKPKIQVEGGELLGFGSANPRTEESYTSGEFTTYYGKAQAVVRANKAGIIRISANADGFEPAFAEIKATD
jgi:hypothetical protein